MTAGVNPVPELKLSTVQEKGQVTIPAGIRSRLGLKKGDVVAFVETDQGVLISPQEVIATAALDQMRQVLRAKGLTLEELDTQRVVSTSVDTDQADGEVETVVNP